MRTVQPMGSDMSISAQVTHASATEEISTMIRHMFHVKHRVAHRAEASGFDAPIAPDHTRWLIERTKSAARCSAQAYRARFYDQSTSTTPQRLRVVRKIVAKTRRGCRLHGFENRLRHAQTVAHLARQGGSHVQNTEYERGNDHHSHETAARVPQADQQETQDDAAGQPFLEHADNQTQQDDQRQLEQPVGQQLLALVQRHPNCERAGDQGDG